MGSIVASAVKIHTQPPPLAEEVIADQDTQDRILLAARSTLKAHTPWATQNYK